MSEQELRQKIIELEAENNRLHDRLVAYKASELQNKDQNINLIKYYDQKYADLFKEIKKTRLDEVNCEIAELSETVNVLADEEEGLLQIVIENENLHAEVATLEADIQARYFQYETATFALNNEIKRLNQKITNYYETYYAELKKFDDAVERYKYRFADDIELNNITEHYIWFIKEKSYPVLRGLKQDERLFRAKTEELAQIEEVFKTEMSALKEQQAALNTEIRDISLNEQKEKHALMAERLAKKEAFLIELTALLATIAEKQMEQMHDEMTKMQLVEATGKEIVTYFDQLLETFKKELLGLDTISNQKERKIQRLEILEDNFAKLDVIEQQRLAVEGEYNHLQSIYLAIKQSLQEVENYLESTSQAIKNSSNYKNIFESYQELQNQNAEYQFQLVNIQDDLRQLKRQRDIVVRDPYGKEKLRLLDEEIQDLNQKRDDLLLVIENTIKARENIVSAPENFGLMAIVQERSECEKRVPEIYNRLSKLKTIIDEKYDEMQNLKGELKEYYPLTKQIEELKNEIND